MRKENSLSLFHDEDKKKLMQPVDKYTKYANIPNIYMDWL